MNWWLIYIYIYINSYSYKFMLYLAYWLNILIHSIILFCLVRFCMIISYFIQIILCIYFIFLIQILVISQFWSHKQIHGYSLSLSVSLYIYIHIHIHVACFTPFALCVHSKFLDRLAMKTKNECKFQFDFYINLLIYNWYNTSN